MTQILEGKKLAQELKQDLQAKAGRYFSDSSYVALVYLGDNSASATYVHMKKKFGENIGLNVHVFGQHQSGEEVEFRNDAVDYDVQLYIKQQYDSVPKLMELIKFLNHDKDCVGIVVQLPLPDEFVDHKAEILASINPYKDIDGLGGRLFGLSSIDLIDFVPATPKSVLYLLEKYELDNFKGKTVSILGQSNLVGKPLAMEVMKTWGTVYSFNGSSPQEEMKQACKRSDYIISCTGKTHLIDQDFVRDDQSQIIVDVGYGYKDGKPVGDVDLDAIKDRVKAYTPVPGGVGPLTVACLFDNVFVLQDLKEQLKNLL